MSMIPHEQLLGELERHHLRLTHVRHATDKQAEAIRCIESLYQAFHAEIAEHGNISSAADMRLLCNKLDEAETLVAAELQIPEATLKHLQSLRRISRRDLERSVGWRAEPLHEHRQPTATGLLALDAARQEWGETPLHIHGNEYLTEDERKASLAIAAILGEVALADYWSATEPERFAFNNRTIENLRSWIGDVQTYTGNFIEDIPLDLLRLPELACLRELLFSALRDKYYSEHYRDSVQGIDPVLIALGELQQRVHETERFQLVNELIDYFIAIDRIPLPSRLREGLGAGEEFPGKHQRIAMQEILRQRQLLLADPTGGGKTGSCIAGFEHLRDTGSAKRMLVTCPSGIVGEWEKRLTDDNGGYFKKGCKPKVVVIRSGDEDRGASWEAAKEADYVIMSIEMCGKQTDGRSHVDLAREVGADFFVVDEAHNVRNPKGNETENIFQISQCDTIRNGFTVAATATPVYNTIEDIAAQLRLLNAGQERLKNMQGIPEGLDFSDINALTRAISFNHTRLVRNLLKLRMLRRTVNDCLPVGTNLTELPPIETPFSELEQEIYDGIRDMPFFESAMEKIRALQSACTHAEEGSDGMGIIGSTKLRQMRDTVLDIVTEWKNAPDTHNGKIVLAVPQGNNAYGITRDFQGNNDPITSDNDHYLMGRLRKELAEHAITTFILDGSNTSSRIERDEMDNIIRDVDGAPMTGTRKIIAAFREHIGPAVLVVRSDVGGEGIDLSFASWNLFANPSSVISEEQQQIGREYRKGQAFDVWTRHLIIRGTIERGKWEFARRKQRIAEDLLDGRPLSSHEVELLHKETKSIQRGGYLGYAAMTPRQKVTHLFNRMFRQGKDRVREQLNAEGGKRGRELADLYRQVENLGTQGNNRRLLLALLQKHAPALLEASGGHLDIADIAAGTLGMTRALSEDERYTVWSTDISGAMLEAGKASLMKSLPDEQVMERAMDDLPYKSGSKHVAFHSLALDCTKHSSRSLDKGGAERINALLELNRILCDGGVAFLTLQASVFENTESFDVFKKTVGTYFGFTLVEEDTGFAQSTDHTDEEQFEGVVLTLRKTGKPRCNAATLPMDAWLALHFYKKAPLVSTEKERFVRTPGIAHPPPGAYHEAFTIAGKDVHYAQPQEPQEKKQHKKRKQRYSATCAAIDRLIQEYGSIKKIPTEQLLSVSLEEIDTTTQRIRDLYFRELLKKYDGRIDAIPLEEISRKSPVILVPMHEKNIGWFLVLATIDPETKKLGTYGKKYFLEEEFHNRSGEKADEASSIDSPIQA